MPFQERPHDVRQSDPCSKVSQLQKRGGLLWNRRKLKKAKIPEWGRKVREEAKYPKVEKRGEQKGS